jgi:undecaprenyl-diphosphatase
LLSIPALAGASFLGIKEAFNKSIEMNYLIIISVILSFLFSYITVKFFLIYIKKFSLNIFVIYRIIVALIMFIIIYF